MTHSCISTCITCVNVAGDEDTSCFKHRCRTNPPCVETSASVPIAGPHSSKPFILTVKHRTHLHTSDAVMILFCVCVYVCDRSRCLMLWRTASHGLITDHMMLLLVSESWVIMGSFISTTAASLSFLSSAGTVVSFCYWRWNKWFCVIESARVRVS